MGELINQVLSANRLCYVIEMIGLLATLQLLPILATTQASMSLHSITMVLVRLSMRLPPLSNPPIDLALLSLAKLYFMR